MTEPTLQQADPEIFQLAENERRRQHEKLRMIPSENYAPRAVLEASGSVLNNKYSEGYAGRRYYEGQQVIDQVEQTAIERLKSLFGVDHANVQPYSGSPANLAVYFAFCNPGDTIMGMSLPSGGHLTHGWNVSISGTYFNSVQYGVRKEDHLLDYDEAAKLAREHKPKLIFCGATAYPRAIDFDKFAEIARDVDAILVADIAHIAGLVAGGSHPSPVGKASVITSTTHKSFRGPRGGMILCNEEHRKAINKSVFPGLQGGPHNATTAGIAVAAKMAATAEFKDYAQRIVDDSRALAETLESRGLELVTGGSDNHLLVADVTPKGATGKQSAKALDRAGIVCNYNTVPFDPRKPFDPSGIRLGTPALASRGLEPDDMKTIGNWIADVLEAPEDESRIERVRGQVKELCDQHPAPGLGIE